ncbi:MAG: hypothetical protein ABL890_03485 [Candidatus Peribacteraceae bacterium]
MQPIEDTELHLHRNHDVGMLIQELREEMFHILGTAIENHSDADITKKERKRLYEKKLYTNEAQGISAKLPDSIDRDLIKAIASEIQKLRDVLIERNTGLAVKALSNNKALARNLQEDQRWSTVEDVMMRAAEKWNPKRAKFSTLVYHSIQRALQNALRKKRESVQSLDDKGRDGEFSRLDVTPDDEAVSPDAGLLHGDVKNRVDTLLEVLPEPVYRRIVELRLGLGGGKVLGWAEIVVELERESLGTPARNKPINKTKAQSLFDVAMRIMKNAARADTSLEEVL